MKTISTLITEYYIEHNAEVPNPALIRGVEKEIREMVAGTERDNDYDVHNLVLVELIYKYGYRHPSEDSADKSTKKSNLLRMANKSI